MVITTNLKPIKNLSESGKRTDLEQKYIYYFKVWVLKSLIYLNI